MTDLNRAELARRATFWAAVADQAKLEAGRFRQLLEYQARQELADSGAAPTWRIPGFASVTLALSTDRVDVVDEAAYTAWVAARHPDNVETITRIRPAFDNLLRTGAAKRGAACDDQGEVIPGLAFVPGGAPKHLSIRISDTARDQVTEQAADAVNAIATVPAAEVTP